ncbi:hypothetical protein HA50_26400 [Pantoea cypripedii]|uniref:Uncharacterized protein n=1 Tax=Pantoea cypripedii TaxID=55209 RepID=A0A1X1EMQ9_PANCY|nr:hypothetical protein [Pantoea cypripedii]ORM90103.1 hypothetical protein HA50_26400 [Pantoea cypripedii]
MGKKTAYTVRFSGLRGVSEAGADFQRDRVADWQRWLRHARDNKLTTIVTCQCLPPEGEEVKRRLKVHLSQSPDLCWLSSYAFTGHDHTPDCRFYSVWPDERQAAIYTTDVVKKDADGAFVIRLPTGLQKKEAGEEKAAVTDRGKKEWLFVSVMDEKRLFAVSLFLPFKPAICGHYGATSVPQRFKHATTRGRLAARVNQRLFIPPFRAVSPENRVEMQLPLAIVQQQHLRAGRDVIPPYGFRVIRDFIRIQAK